MVLTCPEGPVQIDMNRADICMKCGQTIQWTRAPALQRKNRAASLWAMFIGGCACAPQMHTSVQNTAPQPAAR